MQIGNAQCPINFDEFSGGMLKLIELLQISVFPFAVFQYRAGIGLIKWVLYDRKQIFWLFLYGGERF